MSAMSTLDEVKSWLAEQLPALIEKYDVPGAAVAVLAGGEVVDDAAGVLSKATGVEATADSVFQIGSITKLWTSTLVMQLVDEGKVDLDVPVRTYLPEFKIGDEAAAAQITTRQLLNHTPASRATSSPTPASATTASRSTSACCTRCPSCSRSASSSPTTTPASACSAGWSRCSARSRTTTCLREHLFAPLGLTHAATEPVRGDHVPRGDGPRRARAGHRLPARPGLGARPLERPRRLDAGDAPARPARRSPRCTSNDGKAADGTQVLAPGTAGRMHDREVDLPDLGVMGDSWGLGFERFDTADGAIIGHDGSTIGQNAFLRMVPEAGVAVALLTNGGDVLSLYHDIVGHVLAELAGVTPAGAARRRRPTRRSGSTPAGTSAPTPPRSPTWSSARTRTAGSGSSRPPRASSRSSARSRSAASSSTSAATA